MKWKKNGRPQVYNHIITVTFFSSQIKPYLSRKKEKGKKKKLRGSSLMEEHAGTAKLVLDIINTQKNDAR